jgi:hypothetical protein
MRRRYKGLLIAGLALVVVCLGGYLLLSGGRQYSKDMGGLRAQFNQDKGKVRLLMVLSPT